MKWTCFVVLMLVMISTANRHWHFCSYLKGSNMNGGDKSVGDATFLAFIDDATNELFYTVNIPFDFTAITLYNTNNGDVMETLVSSTTPIPAGEYSVAHASSLNYVQKINLKGENAVIRISTENFPDGAVEGKVWHKKVFLFKAEMNEDQEIHDVVPNAHAVGVSVSKLENLDEVINLRWSVRHTMNVADHGLTSAHFHGPGGQNQAADPLSVIAFAEGAESPVSDGLEPIADVNGADVLLSYFLEGLMYTNFHSNLNPSGELRGHCLRVRSPRFTVNPLLPKFVVPPPDVSFRGIAKKIIFDHELNYIRYVIDTDIPRRNQGNGGFFGEASKGQSNGDYQVNLRYGVEKPDKRKGTLVKGTVALFSGVNGGPEGMFEAFIQEKYSIQYEHVNKGPVVRGQIRNWDWNKRKIDWINGKKKRSFVAYSDIFP